MQVRSLGREDLLDKEMANQSSILADSPWGRKGSDMTEQQAWHDINMYTHMEQLWARPCARYVHFSFNIYHNCIF